ncbi:MAG: polysaccharide pyruvyl transferase [Peptococcaceae bacterium BICA1-7]|nr:MAG: polysaccharide pyruvyl transferase [Peptococcaceae bacterium BICA1-7]HBV96284.1 polysaccharide pyruvyl transferase CsaB [Desulfotomaculum sp.]
MPRVVISGYHGFKNNGDEAMLYAMLKALDQRIQGLEVVVLSKNPVETQDFFGVRAVPRHDLRTIIGEIRGADLLISGGGGLLQDVTGPNSILYYLGIVSLAKMMKKPVFFYGQGIGPIETLLGRTMMRLVANRVDVITVRDRESSDELCNLGVVRPLVEVTADPALGLDTAEIDPGPGIAILNGAGIPTGDGLVGVSVRGWKGQSAYKTVIARTCDDLIGKGRNVVFLPMHYPEDVAASKEIAAMMKNSPFIVERQLNFKDMLSLMKQTSLIVGMRLHFLIFGSLLNIPMVGISYDPKVDRFLRLADMPSGGTVENLDYQEFSACIEMVSASTGELKERLARKVALLRQEALRGADLVEKMLKG